MTWAADAYSRGTWAASADTEMVVPGQQTLPPPIPDGTTTITYTGWTGLTSWSYFGWSGGNGQASYPGGGVSIAPVPARGVMTVSAWWPFAPALQLLRIAMDGTETPVRGGYPLVPTTATRRNSVQNPSLETGLNGYVADAGTPTLSRPTTPTVTAPWGSYVLRCTVSGAGSCGVTVPTDLTGSLPVTVAFDMQLSARPTGVRVTIGWTDAGGGALTGTTINLTADQINYSVTQWGRQVVTATPPVNAFTPTLKIIADGMPAGGIMDLDGLVFEAAITDGSFFDGTVPGGTWIGTTHLSASVLAPILTMDDGECPMDEQVSYLLVNPSVSGGLMLSAPATLSSIGTAWLTHPATPGVPVKVVARETPVLTHPLPRGVFRPIGRKHPVVVSVAERQAPEGEIKLNALTEDDRELLLETFDDGAPVLIRTPGDWTFDDRWMSLGDLTEDPEGRGAYQPGRLLSAPFVSVDPPDASV